jgi:hypothetical protein
VINVEVKISMSSGFLLIDGHAYQFDDPIEMKVSCINFIVTAGQGKAGITGWDKNWSPVMLDIGPELEKAYTLTAQGENIVLTISG